MHENTKNSIMQLIDKCRDVVVCSVDEGGFPAAKAMTPCQKDGAHTFWFCTNVSHARTGQFMKNPKVCVYFMDTMGIHGLSLTGTMVICDDEETKSKFWFEGAERFYPLGPTDPDYCVLKFAVEKGNYYHNLRKHLFVVTGKLLTEV